MREWESKINEVKYEQNRNMQNKSNYSKGKERIISSDLPVMWRWKEELK